MIKYILLALIIFPALEMALLVKLGSEFGILPTLLVVLGTGVIGAFLAKQQGLKAFKQAMTDYKEGVISPKSVFDGVFLFIAAAFLFIPGTISDIIGLIVLIPAIRTFIMAMIIKKFQFAYTNKSSQQTRPIIDL